MLSFHAQQNHEDPEKFIYEVIEQFTKADDPRHRRWDVLFSCMPERAPHTNFKNHGEIGIRTLDELASITVLHTAHRKEAVLQAMALP